MSKFYFRVMIKNVLFLLVLLGILFYNYVTREAASISIARYTSLYTFALAISCVGMMIICVHTSGKRFEVMNYLESKYQRFKNMLLAAIKIISILYIVILVGILLYINSENSLLFNIKGLIHFSLIWYLSNLLMIVIGLGIGMYISNFFRYILAIFLSLPFMIQITKGALESRLETLFNVFDDKLFSPPNHGAGVIFNEFYLLDKVFILMFILFILHILYIFLKGKKCRYAIISICLFISVQCLIYYKINKSIDVIDISMTNNTVQAQTKDSYYIKQYDMNINLGSKLYNNCNVKLIIEKENLEEIILNLDRKFNIKKLLLDDESIDYSFTEGKVIIPIKNLKIEKNKEIDINIEYSGKVYIGNSLGTDSVYTSKTANTLIDNVTNWYPTINEKRSHQFKIKGTSLLEVYGNIDIKNTKHKFLSNKFEAEGNAYGLSLISGNYEVYNHNGIEIISPKNVFSERFANLLPDYALELFNAESKLIDKKILEENLKKIKEKEYKRIILASGLGSVGYIDGDTLILDSSWID